MRADAIVAFAWAEVRLAPVVADARRTELENMKVDAFPNHRYPHGLLSLQ